MVFSINIYIFLNNQLIKQDLIDISHKIVNAMTCCGDNIKLTKMIPFPFSPSS